MSFWKPGEQQAPSSSSSSSSRNSTGSGRGSGVGVGVSDSKKNTTSNNDVDNSPQQQGNGNRLSLSKGVMTMKFMKRKADADQAMMDDAEKRRKLLDDQWSCEPQDSTAMQIEGVEVEVDIVTASHNGHHERSHTTRYERVEGDLMSALPGRRSFGGYNPAVERHYASVMDEKSFNAASDKVHKHSVSDQEMLDRYQNLIGLPRGPNQGMKPPKTSGRGGSGGGGGRGGDGRGGGRGDSGNNSRGSGKNADRAGGSPGQGKGQGEQGQGRKNKGNTNRGD